MEVVYRVEEERVVPLSFRDGRSRRALAMVLIFVAQWLTLAIVVWFAARYVLQIVAPARKETAP
jgi:hypothetical protein